MRVVRGTVVAVGFTAAVTAAAVAWLAVPAVLFVALAVPVAGIAAFACRGERGSPPVVPGRQGASPSPAVDASPARARGDGERPATLRPEDQLSLAAAAVRADRVVLLTPSDDGRSLRVGRAAPEIESPTKTVFQDVPRDAGLPGAVLRSGEPLAATLGAQAARLCPYYREPAERLPAQALVVPLDGPRGPSVLIAEREDEQAPFGKREATALVTAARVLSQTARIEETLRAAMGRVEALERMAEATNGLVRDDPDAVAEVARSCVAAARRLVVVDAAVVSVYRPDEELYRVIYAEGAKIAPDASFSAAAGLAGQAGRVRTALPAGGRITAEAGAVLAPELPFPPFDAGALAVMPLVAGGVLVGSLALAARDPKRYDREQLRVLRQSVANVTGVQLARRNVEASLADLARTDALTGTVNRRAFDEALPAALARSRRYGHPTSLLVVDLDRFKSVNDRHGHALGDVVLGTVGQLLRNLARNVDVPARLGGDEFALLLEHTDVEGARRVAERVRQALAHTPFADSTSSFRVTASIGVAACPRDAEKTGALFEAADAALYRAKDQGGNAVVTAGERRAAP